ncbi:MAG TPA: MarR family transcriptional regulator [bacterium]|nr:MarR family transcriptional regulator [bacterium]
MTPAMKKTWNDGPARVPDSMLERMGFLLNRSTQKMNEIALRTLEPLGLMGKHLGVLLTLKEKGPIPQQEIGNCIHVDRTTMVQIVDDLERLGLVERKDNPEDRRAYSLSVTAKGRETLTKGLHLVSSAEKEFFADLPSKDQKELVRILKHLVLSHYYPQKA